jgi:hypothetical protein
MTTVKKEELLYHLTLCMINFNGERYLEESLRSVFIQKEKFKEILLIDNASEDRSLKIVKERFPTVRVIKLDENQGPGVARNVGYKSASCNLILFMDNDVMLTPDCTDRLIETLNDNPHAALVMPRVLYARDKNIIQYDGAYSHFLGLMILNNANKPLILSSIESKKLGSIVTACFLMDRSRWNGVEPFDESFYFNYEDHDFGFRTRTMGHEIVSAPSACCYHREGTKGLSFRSGGNYSRIRVFCLIRNRWQIILKNYSFKTLILLSPIFLVYELFQISVVIKKGWHVQWVKAFMWMLLHSPDILRKRQAIQKSRKTDDCDILRDGSIPFTHDLTKSTLERTGKNLLNFLASVYWNGIKRFI